MGKILIIKGADYSNVAIETIVPYPSEASHYFPLTSDLSDVIGELQLSGNYNSISEDGVLFTRQNNDGLYMDYTQTLKAHMVEYKYAPSATVVDREETVMFAGIAGAAATGAAATGLYLQQNSDGSLKDYNVTVVGGTTITQDIRVNIHDGNWHKIMLCTIGESSYLIVDGIVEISDANWRKAISKYVLGNSKNLINGSSTSDPIEGYVKNLVLFNSELTLTRACEICQ